MTFSSATPDLKEINAYKKKINWGQVSAQYHMVATSAGELDGLLSHGFESGFTMLLNKKNWNPKVLGGTKQENGEYQFAKKPKVSLRHIYTDMGYELHCFPMIANERINFALVNNKFSPFKQWLPEAQRRLFRVNHLANFIIQTVQNGDEADKELVKHIFIRVCELLNILQEQLDVQEIKGYSIAEFIQEVKKKSEFDPFVQE